MALALCEGGCCAILMGQGASLPPSPRKLCANCSPDHSTHMLVLNQVSVWCLDRTVIESELCPNYRRRGGWRVRVLNNLWEMLFGFDEAPTRLPRAALVNLPQFTRYNLEIHASSISSISQHHNPPTSLMFTR